MWPFKKKYPYPDAAWADRVCNLHPRTPDHAELAEKSLHPLFVYDTLKEDQINHRVLEGAEIMGPGFTQQKFTMRVKNVGKFSQPIVSEGDDGRLPKLRVFGEVIKVPWRKFYELDNFKENGVQFIRQQVEVILPYKKIFIKDRGIAENLFHIPKSEIPYRGVFHVKAFIYVGVSEYWRPLYAQDNDYDNLYPPGRVHKVNHDWIKECYNFVPSNS